jgi:hypothetical protein
VLLERRLVYEVIVGNDTFGKMGFSDSNSSQDEERLESVMLKPSKYLDCFTIFLVYGYFAHGSRG